MARTPKTGLDYFSHDVNMASDRKIKLLKAKNGLVGYAVYLRLLEEAYRESGYYLECSEEFDLLFASDNNIDIDVYINIVNDCINYKLFDSDLYDKFKILTSKRMQKNFFDATTRRQKVEVYSEYLLVDFDKCDINPRNVNIISLNVDINSINEDIGTQRKGKEIERKGDIKESSIYRKFEHLKITEAEVEKLENNYSRKQIDDILDRIENYKGNNKYKSLYLTAKRWLEKEPKKEIKQIRQEIPVYMQEFVPEEQ